MYTGVYIPCLTLRLLQKLITGCFLPLKVALGTTGYEEIVSIQFSEKLSLQMVCLCFWARRANSKRCYCSRDFHRTVRKGTSISVSG